AETAEAVASSDEEAAAASETEDETSTAADADASEAEDLETDADFDVDLEPLSAASLEDEDDNENRDERGRILIDDLRPSDVWLSEGRDEEDEVREGPLETLLFAILALVGAGLFTYGGSAEFGWFGMEQAEQTEMMAYLPPFLMLLGGLICIVMAYYCIKALMGGKQEG
ncbi:MAG: hypothetical protein COA64_02660, partial [Henriciella sp.]